MGGRVGRAPRWNPKVIQARSEVLKDRQSRVAGDTYTHGAWPTTCVYDMSQYCSSSMGAPSVREIVPRASKIIRPSFQALHSPPAM